MTSNCAAENCNHTALKMGRKCCVPGCRTNYEDESKFSVFTFPKDDDLKRKWLRQIPRELEVTKQTVVCELHFLKEFVLREDAITRSDGTLLVVPRKIPKLSKDAYPSIFPNLPGYMSSLPRPKRKCPDKRRQEVRQREEQAEKHLTEIYSIKDYDAFLVDSARFLSKYSLSDVWMFQKGSDRCCFCLISWLEARPITTCVAIDRALKVSVFENGERIHLQCLHSTEIESQFLTSWSGLQSLLNTVISRNKEKEVADILHHIDALKGCVVESEEYPSDQVKLLIELLELLFSRQPRYSSDVLLLAFQIHAYSVKAYMFLRNSLLKLPHPSYLRKISSAYSVVSGVKEEQHFKFLKKKCELAHPKERLVVLMLDEIYISSQISYKCGELQGLAENCDLEEASTVQVFMISSLLSDSKDVAAIVPVKNMNGAFLYDITKSVLGMLFRAGYYVVCLVADNNKVNGAAFTEFCGGSLKPSIPHPFNSGKRLYFLFDSVHLMKCVRNNWLSQKDCEKTFVCPQFEALTSQQCITTGTSIESATIKPSFNHLRKLYHLEQNSIAKLAPALSYKAMYPNGTEKQNVFLMQKVFDEKNVVALKHLQEKRRSFGNDHLPISLLKRFSCQSNDTTK